MTKGRLADRGRHGKVSMGMFHLYRGETTTLVSFVWASEDAGHVIEEEGIEVSQPIRDYEVIQREQR